MRKPLTLLFIMPQVSSRDQSEETRYTSPAGVETVPVANFGTSFLTNLSVCIARPPVTTKSSRHFATKGAKVAKIRNGNSFQFSFVLFVPFCGHILFFVS